MKRLQFDWHYDNKTESYVFGTANDGGGVFIDTGKWYGNSVVKDNSLIVSIGPCENWFNTLIAVEKDYIIRSNLDLMIQDIK
jgi:hypothetical protein